jgi:hypothetical protein
MMRTWMKSPKGRGEQVVELKRDATLALPRGASGVRVQVRSGTVLVTQAGDPEDHVLRTGEVLTLPPGGLVVAWALTPSTVSLRGPLAVDAAEPLQHCA